MGRVERWISWGGFALGVGIALCALAGWRVAGGDGRLGADVTFSAAATGELDLPTGIMVQAPDLRPGRRARGSVPVRNRTGSTVAVRLRALPSTADLDELLMVRVGTADAAVYEGSLRGLRSWSRESFELTPGASEDLLVTTWLPGSLGDGYAARIGDVSLELRAEPVEA